MPRTLMPTPDDPRPDVQALLVDDPLDLEAQAVLDLLRGEYVTARGLTAAIQPEATSGLLEPPAPQLEDGVSARPSDLVYLPAAWHCYAIVQYVTASAPVVRRVVGLFGDVGTAEQYARVCGYHLYDVVQATAVIAKTP